MLAALALTCLLAQAEGAPKPKVEDPPTRAVVKALSDAEARAAISAFHKISAKASLADRLGGIETLAAGSHETLVPILEKTVRADSSLAVRKRAAAALGDMPEKKAYPTVVKLLAQPSVGDMPELAEPLVRSLARVGYRDKDWDRIEGLFRAGYEAERVPVQRAVLALILEHKEKQAIHLLLDNLDEPLPSNVDHADNPPAEYWERRWKAWKVWRDECKAALQAVTGQKFGTADEARAWLERHGKKNGFKGF